MGLDIYTLRHPTFVKPREQASDEDWDTLTRIYNDPSFTGHSDGRPQGFYRGERSKGHGSWSYGGYSHLRRLLCRVAFGAEPEAVWQSPERFARQPHGDLVALINFSDCEGAIGPVTCGKLAAALEGLSVEGIADAEARAYARYGRERLLACFRDAAEHNGFAVWA